MSSRGLDAARIDELSADLSRANDEFIAGLERAAAVFDRAPAGKWSAGQHADHLARTYAAFAGALEAAVRDLAAGALAPRPRRWPLQALVIHLLTAGPKFPRGGRAAPFARPLQPADPAVAIEALRRSLARLLAATAALSVEARDRTWFPSPVVPRWHYTLPEALRVNALHTRHHAMLVAELMKA